MRGTRRGFLGAVLVACLIAAGASATVGQPPTMHLHRCDRDLRPCGDPVVIGQKKTFVGPLQMVGMHSDSYGFCIYLDYVEQGFSLGSCRHGQTLPRHHASIDFQLVGVGRTFSGRKRIYTHATGALSPEVSSVEFRYRRNGNEKVVDAVVAQVSDDLQTQLEEPDPFGYWAVTLRGCSQPRSFRAEAFDSEGSSLGIARAAEFGGLCGGFKEKSASGKSLVTN